MNTKAILALAVKHVGANPERESSARLCLADARAQEEKGDLEAARRRALDSLKHSIGILHPDYRKAVGAQDIEAEVDDATMALGSQALQAYLRDIETNVAAFRAAVEGGAPLRGNILHRARETYLISKRAYDFVKGMAGV